MYVTTRLNGFLDVQPDSKPATLSAVSDFDPYTTSVSNKNSYGKLQCPSIVQTLPASVTPHSNIVNTNLVQLCCLQEIYHVTFL